SSIRMASGDRSSPAPSSRRSSARAARAETGIRSSSSRRSRTNCRVGRGGAEQNKERSMRVLSRRLFGPLLLVGCTQAASAQTADEVVEKYLAAIGGREALGKLKSRTMTGTITVATPGGEVSGPVEIVNEAPNKARTLIKLDLSAFGAGQMTFDQRFNGTSGYVIDTLQGDREITGGQLEAMKNVVFPTPLLKYEETGATVEL